MIAWIKNKFLFTIYLKTCSPILNTRVTLLCFYSSSILVQYEWPRNKNTIMLMKLQCWIGPVTVPSKCITWLKMSQFQTRGNYSGDTIWHNNITCDRIICYSNESVSRNLLIMVKIKIKVTSTLSILKLAFQIRKAQNTIQGAVHKGRPQSGRRDCPVPKFYGQEGFFKRGLRSLWCI